MSQKKFNISDLDINNIGAWPQKAKLVFCAILVLFFLLLGYLFAYRGQQETLEELERTESTLRSSLLSV